MRIAPVPWCSSDASSPPVSSTTIDRYIHVSSTISVAAYALYTQRRDKRPRIKLKARAHLVTLLDGTHREGMQLRVIPAFRLAALSTGEKGTVFQDLTFRGFSIHATQLPLTAWGIPTDARCTHTAVMPQAAVLYSSPSTAIAFGWFTASDMHDRRYRSRPKILVWRHLDEYSAGYRLTGFIVRLRRLRGRTLASSGKRKNDSSDTEQCNC